MPRIYKNPDPLLSLIHGTHEDPDGPRAHTRGYNALTPIASIVTDLDLDTSSRPAPFVYRIHGSTYQRIR